MKTEAISAAALKSAAKNLKDVLAQPKNEYIRDAAIQRFEYTFELAWKTLKRYLESINPVLEFNLKELFREAAKQGLINSVENWLGYLRARDQTSHTYNEITAEQTYEAAKEFSIELEPLIQKLEKLLG